MTNELKPCPLCGPESFIVPFTRQPSEPDAPFWTAVLKCDYCGISLSGTGVTEELALKSAIEAWNTRAERTCKPIPKYGDDSPWPVMVCSECGRPLHYDEHTESDYPPYCGCGAKVVE